MVLCQRGNTIWIHNNRNNKKVVICKTKPYQLVESKTGIVKNEHDLDIYHCSIEK